jgi:hypothetical protein
MTKSQLAHGVRRDGWTPARRSRFLAVLAEVGSVSVASGICGLSRASVYQLRRRDAGFARQWAEALVAHVPRQEREYHAVVAALLARAATIQEARNISPWTQSTYQPRVNFAGPC